MAELRSAADTWQQRDATGGEVDFGVFKALRDVLQKCPGRATAAASTDLAFLKDPDLARDLAEDLAEINAAIANGEWKSATVIGGSLLEALLLWQHQRDPVQARSAAAAVVTKKAMKQPPTELLDWTLYALIEAACEASLITERTATLARLTKDYRNLIHPGRAIRLSEKPDRSTALAAAAAAEAVIRELRVRCTRDGL
jgi:hypothetical protein